MLKKLNGSRKHNNPEEQGAALLSAVFLVTVMVMTTFAVIEQLRFSMRLSANMQLREQARLYALAAEQLISASLKAAHSLPASGQEPRYPHLDAWTQKPIFFPIDGGDIKGRIIDGSNCFNLNAVVKHDDNGYLIADDAVVKKYTRLLELAGIPPGEAVSLSNSLTDWIDTDSLPRYGGAEDPDYSILTVPYRTSQNFLSDISELKVIKGYTAELVQHLQNWVCVRPSTELNILNLNTLNNEDSVLVLTYLGDEFTDVEFQTLLAQRTKDGFQSKEDFFSLDLFTEERLESVNKALFGLMTSFFDISAEINYYDVEINVYSTLQIQQDGAITIISRSYGTF